MEYNYKHVQTTCPECKHTDILVDPMHQETYCTHCGLIIHDNYSIFQITRILEQEQAKNIRANQFWKRTNSRSRGKRGT